MSKFVCLLAGVAVDKAWERGPDHADTMGHVRAGTLHVSGHDAGLPNRTVPYVVSFHIPHIYDMDLVLFLHHGLDDYRDW